MPEYNEAKEDAIEMLNNWGAWCANHGINMDYPHIEPFRRMLGGGVGLPPIDDSEGEQIDSAVSTLKKAFPEAQEILVLRYVHGMYLHEMKGFGYSRAKARQYHDIGLSWVLSQLLNS